MITENTTDRLKALSPLAKKLLFTKIKEAFSLDASKTNKNQRQRIKAYIKGNSDFSVEQLKENLKSKLPDYMIPSQFISVDKIPLLPNGKIDRKQLNNAVLAPKKVKNNQTTNSNTNGNFEKKLIKIWEEILGFSPINKNDNFFEVGGDSILSIQIIAKAKKEGIVLKANDLFKYQTIAELALFSDKIVENKSDTEEKLIKIWEETLGFSPINKNDNFFEIGGDSILSIQIIAKAKKEGIILKANDLFKHQTIAELTLFTDKIVENKSDNEEKLIKIWEETLGFAPINKSDNFFEIGGDSILSIQIIAKAKKEGIVLKANDLFKHQTIAELALFTKTETQEKITHLVNGIVPLSPIQHWFFEDHKNAPNYWNQGVQLDNLPSCTKDQIETISKHIVTQHDILRAKFSFKENKWVQEIISPYKISALEFIDLSNTEEENYKDIALKHAKRIQQNFDLAKGSLFKCIYFSTATGSDFCKLISHHLLVDAVSWQIIVDDFTSIIEKINTNKNIVSETKTNSFKEWVHYITLYANTMSNEELSFWQSQITPVAALPLDNKSLKTIIEEDIVELTVNLDTATTQSLIAANKTLNTKTEELVITSFVDVISNWSGADKITIGFERHGRETEDSNLDVSKTVGWFTSYFPLQFTHQTLNSIDNKVIAVKEKMRSIPNGGIGYGGLRYIKNTFAEIENPEIAFNYLGTQFSTKNQHKIKTTTLTKDLRDVKSERNYKLEINALIIDNVLTVSFRFSKKNYDLETIAKLTDRFKETLLKICEYCNQTTTGRYTPSDFSETDLSQEDLDNLLDIL